MATPVGGGANGPGPVVKAEEESFWVFRAGRAVWSAARNVVMSVLDSQFTIVGSSDATKTLKFEVDGQSTGADLTIAAGAQTADRTATLPVLTGNSILTLSNVTLTSGRVPFTTTNGILTDSADFTYSATALALGTSGVAFGGATASSGQLSFYTNSSSAFFGNFGNPPGDVVGFSIPGFIGYKFNTVTLAHSFDNGTVNIADTSISALTVGGCISAPASSTARASIKLPHGTAPTSPVDGDMWTTTAGLYVRINGATVGPLS